jgi:mRNA interferase RelE/StbE
MSYRVIATQSAQREIAKLPKDIQRRITEHFPLLEANPRPNGAIKLEGSDVYRLPVGDYRIIYTIEDDIVTVTIIRVAHRSIAYRRP